MKTPGFPMNSQDRRKSDKSLETMFNSKRIMIKKRVTIGLKKMRVQQNEKEDKPI